MSRTIDGSLILGWEVEVCAAANYDRAVGPTIDAEDRVTEILGRTWIERPFCDPITYRTVYHEYDYMYVGLMLANNDCGSFEFEAKEYGEFLSANAALLTKTAKELYTAIMGTEPADEPKLLIVGSEG